MLPLTIDALLILVLLGLALTGRGTPVETIILSIILIPLVVVLLELFSRKVVTGERGIMIWKLLRKKDLSWDQITDLGALVLRKKIYLALTTTKGFHILSNSYEDFNSLACFIVDHLDRKKVEEKVIDLVSNPVRRISEIVSAWLVTAILFTVVAAKLF